MLGESTGERNNFGFSACVWRFETRNQLLVENRNEKFWGEFHVRNRSVITKKALEICLNLFVQTESLNEI